MGIQIIISTIILLVITAILVGIYLYLVRKAFGATNADGATATVDENQIPGTNRNVVGRVNRVPSMSSDEIKELPCFDYYEVEERENGRVECAVCLENFKGGEKCRMLPICTHTFHVQCIDLWLLRTAVCPICRTRANETQTQTQSGDSSEVGVALI